MEARQWRRESNVLTLDIQTLDIQTLDSQEAGRGGETDV